MQRYESYKDSGVEWMGEIPSNWCVKKLKYILKFATGGTPPTHQEGLYDGEEPWITISDINGKYISSSHFISKRGVKSARIPLTPKGSLLYSFKLSVGQVAFANQDLYTNEAIASFYPKSDVNLNFWFYALPIFVIRNANTNIYGAYLLNQDLINNALLVVPSLEEQNRIAAFLDEKIAEIESAIAKKQHLIELLQEQKSILINQAVTRGFNPDVPLKDSGVQWLGEIPLHWNTIPIKRIIREIDFRSKTGEEPLLSLRMNGRLIKHIDVSDKPISLSQLVGYKIVRPRQLVMNRMRASMGLFAVADEEGIVSPDYAVFETSDYILPEYLLYVFRNTSIKHVFLKESKGLGTGSSGFLRLYTDRFGIIKVPLPAYPEQLKIIDAIKSIEQKFDEIFSLIEKEIKNLVDFRSSVIAHVVTGKVRICDNAKQNK